MDCIEQVFIDVLGKVLCMDCFPEKKTPGKDEKSLPRNRRYLTGQRFECSNGYNKWSENWKSSAEHLFQGKRDSESIQSNNSTPLRSYEASYLEKQVSDIRTRINEWAARTAERERRDKMAKEWKQLALVLDRIFFLIYLTTVIVSLATIFTQPNRM